MWMSTIGIKESNPFDWILENVPWKVISRRKKRLAQRLVLGKMMKSAKCWFCFSPAGLCCVHGVAPGCWPARRGLTARGQPVSCCVSSPLLPVAMKTSCRPTHFFREARNGNLGYSHLIYLFFGCAGSSLLHVGSLVLTCELLIAPRGI